MREKFFIPNPGQLAGPLLFSALVAASALSLPRVVQNIIDLIRSGAGFQALLRWLFIFSVAALISAGCKFITSFLFASFASKIGENIRLRLAGKILEIGETSRESTALTALTHDIRSFTDFFQNGLQRISGSFWLYGLGLFFMASLNGKYLVPTLAASLISFLIAFLWHRRLECWYQTEREKFAGFQRAISEWFSRWEWIRGRGREDEITEEFEARSAGHLGALLRANISSAGIVPVLMILWAAVSLVFIAIGASEYRAGRLTLGGVAASFQYLVFFSMPTLDLCYGGDLWRKARVAWRQIALLLDHEPELQNSKVSFPRFHVIPLSEISENDWKLECRAVGGIYLDRESLFFSRTLLENFLLIEPQPTLEEIEASMRSACLINGDAGNLYSWLERNPNTFSSGERKRTALARVFLIRDAPVWVLEDPTAGLNAEIVEKLLESLSRFREKRSVIIFSDDPRVQDWAGEKKYV